MTSCTRIAWTDTVLHSGVGGVGRCGQKVPRPLVVAGYSAGELAAWGVAGLITPQGF